MCGIFGSTEIYSREILGKKLSSMNFRGPDNQTCKCFELVDGKKLTLGHVRLSILDLETRSNQPFQYNDYISVVFNGEIYNYQSLRDSYLAGCKLKTRSDTEILCAMYELFGNKCVEYFNGMFAFVIYDRKKNILFGARDRLGKKPFYYHLTENSFEFSSQLTAILIGNTHSFTISSLSRQYYLLNGYIPDPYSIFDEIRKLRAGQSFTLSLSNYKMEINTYWDIFSNSSNFTKPKSYNEAKETVKQLLHDAVRIRLNAEVPVGLFLSGGIDSSLTCAVTSTMNKKITAYTIGFNDSHFDESNYASKVAATIGIPFVSKKCEGDDMMKMFRGISTFFDEPFADFSLIPTCLLAEKAKDSVTVALGGDGADELFMGYYDHYKEIERRKYIFKYIPYGMRKCFWEIIKNHPYGYRYKHLQYKTVLDSYLTDGRYGHFYGAEKYNKLELAMTFPDNNYLDEKRDILMFSDNDIKFYLNSCINTKADRSTMRSSLELRSPMMDYRLAEYSRLLPLEYHVDKHNGGKRILKDILFEMVPRDLLERPKMGFSPPVGQWFRNELRNYVTTDIKKEILEEAIPEIDSKKIFALREEFLKGRRISGLLFFKLYMYIEWYKYIKLLLNQSEYIYKYEITYNSKKNNWKDCTQLVLYLD